MGTDVYINSHYVGKVWSPKSSARFRGKPVTRQAAKTHLNQHFKYMEHRPDREKAQADTPAQDIQQHEDQQPPHAAQPTEQGRQQPPGPESATEEQAPKAATHHTRPLFSKDRDAVSRQEAVKDVMDHTSKNVQYHKLILSPDRYGQPENGDGKQWLRSVMADMERKMGIELHWYAAEHTNTANTHYHIVIAGSGKDRARSLLEPAEGAVPQKEVILRTHAFRQMEDAWKDHSNYRQNKLIEHQLLQEQKNEERAKEKSLQQEQKKEEPAKTPAKQQYSRGPRGLPDYEIELARESLKKGNIPKDLLHKLPDHVLAEGSPSAQARYPKELQEKVAAYKASQKELEYAVVNKGPEKDTRSR